ncbi:MAG: winged helix-turn-helix domain-containing protein [Caldilineaceae bacterium]|nr:winged helix-turn-helix domain-containing protein [Caldilineaceae bacterium]
MPATLRLSDDSYMRHTDVQRVLAFLNDLRCVEITGFSNLGKSALMRLLAQTDVWVRELGEAGAQFLPVYIDCNRMLEMTDQGFYELVLRCLQESSPVLAEDGELVAAYDTLIAPASEFQVPLSFSRGLTAALNTGQGKIVLLFDEFDEPFQQIDSRVFINLRAKKDGHSDGLAYVTATVRSLAELSAGDHGNEFCELFVHQSWRLAPLTAADVEKYVIGFGERHGVPLQRVDAEFVYQWTGGHPGMLDGVCHLIADALHSEPEESADRWALHRALVPKVRREPVLVDECDKIWQELTSAERDALLALFSGEAAESVVTAHLRQRHLLLDVAGEPRLFGRLMAVYVQQKVDKPAAQAERLWVDRDSGEVLVNGKAAETLTRLEYQLMLLLFDNVDKIVDKYQIVAGVWGEDYIDSVDDARIEKLVSRLRQKIEPDPASPQFVTTVRGRGYRLVLG